MDQIPGQYHDGIITVVAQNSSFIGEVSFHIDYEKDIVEYNREIIPAIFECLLILQNYVITLRVFNEERTVNIYQPGSKEVNEPRKYVASWVAYNGEHAEEYAMIASALPSINGSSPRMRRSIFHPLNSFSRAWFIPAYAGSTLHVFFVTFVCLTHPRKREECVAAQTVEAGVDGSSPHTRGICMLQELFLHIVRLIPACAGSTLVNQHRNSHYT